MELGKRKRSRKSRSFKLVTDEEPSPNRNNPVRGLKDAPAVQPDDWFGNKDMEIKRQITGMMRVYSDRSSRMYQRTGTEQSQDSQITWGQQAAPLLLPSDHHQNNWSSTSVETSSALTSPLTNGLSTRSRALRLLHSTENATKAPGVNDVAPPSAAEPPCCMCNCKDTLQAILQELRVMRKLMQSQKEKQEVAAASPCQPHLSGSASRHRAFRRRPVYKVSPLTVSLVRRAAEAPPAESGTRRESEKEPEPFRADLQSISELSVEARQGKHTPISEHTSLLNQPRTQLAPESEVRLAEDYDVFISKSQLDSILINYTRSGSLLFRKLVCAFFDDATLATSLPNGKRKRGLNDNRKGLDQNVVGAIKEKYCTDHKVEKLPGPRDWVQILQDQIKLARRRLKRDAAEEGLNGTGSVVNV